MTAIQPTGFEAERALATALEALSELADEMNDQLNHLNDEKLRAGSELLVTTTKRIVSSHLPSPRASAADDLVGLLSAVRSLEVPLKDQSLGRTPTLDRLRSLQGLMISGL